MKIGMLHILIKHKITGTFRCASKQFKCNIAPCVQFTLSLQWKQKEDKDSKTDIN